MKKVFVYPAIFNKEEDGYWSNFIDFDSVYSDGDTLEEVMANTSNALGFYLEDLKEYPTPTTDISKIKLDKNQFISFISVDMEVYKEKFSDKAVKKTLSLPAWINTLALEKKINFSEVLKEALIKKLGIDI
nr:MAG TPA: putative nuclease [Caudoviricetes sp.]DAQ87211.1 MAG TPA: putative nuclease [Caudoviricetes sp.]